MKKILTAVVLPIFYMSLQPAAQSGEMPPPGLYRIDMDSTMAFAGQPVQTRMVTQGSNGDTEAQWKAGAKSASRQFKGNAPLTQCVKTYAGVSPMPPGGPLSCKSQATAKTADGMVHTATCPMGKISTTIRQLDSERWEYLIDVDMVASEPGTSTSGMAYVLKRQAENGATMQERAKAKAQLAQLPGLQKEIDAGRAEAIAELQKELNTTTDPEVKATLQKTLVRVAPGAPVMKTHSRQVWTRIADSCK